MFVCLSACLDVDTGAQDVVEVSSRHGLLVVNGEDGSCGHVAVDVGRPVEGVKRHAVLACDGTDSTQAAAAAGSSSSRQHPTARVAFTLGVWSQHEPCMYVYRSSFLVEVLDWWGILYSASYVCVCSDNARET